MSLEDDVRRSVNSKYAGLDPVEQGYRLMGIDREKDKEKLISRFNTAKAKMSNARTATEYGNLAEEFAAIQRSKSIDRCFSDADRTALTIECFKYVSECERKEKEYKKNELPSRLATTKAKMSNARTATEYGSLVNEFTAIAQGFQSIFDYSEAQPYIEECNNCRRQCEEKEKERKKDELPSRLAVAKTKMSNMRTVAEYGELANEFAAISQALQSLLGYTDVQAQIEECSNYRRHCEEKAGQYKKDEFLSRFAAVKAKIPDMRTDEQYRKLTEEFTSIEKDFGSLPSSFGLQVQIEECKSFHKQFDEKWQSRKSRKEATSHSVIKIIKYTAIVSAIIGALFFGILASTWSSFFLTKIFGFVVGGFIGGIVGSIAGSIVGCVIGGIMKIIEAVY